MEGGAEWLRLSPGRWTWAAPIRLVARLTALVLVVARPPVSRMGHVPQAVGARLDAVVETPLVSRMGHSLGAVPV